MKRAIAGPTMRALIAAAIGRVFVQCGSDAGVADYRKSGVSAGDINGVQLRTENCISIEPGCIQARLNWEIRHAKWTLRFTERRELDEDGAFVRAAPYQIALLGDLLEAARFLGLARTMYLDALKADGWSANDVTVEGLRWVEVPYGAETPHLRLVLQGS